MSFRLLLLVSLIAYTTASEWESDDFFDHDELNFMSEEETEEETNDDEPFQFTELESRKKTDHTTAAKHTAVKAAKTSIDANQIDSMLDSMQKEVERKLKAENIAIPKLATDTKHTAASAANAANNAYHVKYDSSGHIVVAPGHSTKPIAAQPVLDSHGNIIVPVTMHDKSAGPHASTETGGHAAAKAHSATAHSGAHKHLPFGKKLKHVQHLEKLAKQAAAAGVTVMPKKQLHAKEFKEKHPDSIKYDPTGAYGGKTGHTHTVSISETFSVSASNSVSVHQHSVKSDKELKPGSGGYRIPADSFIIPKQQLDAPDVYEAAPKEVTKVAEKAAEANAIAMAMKAKLAAEELTAAEKKIKRLEAEKFKILKEKEKIQIHVEVAPLKDNESEPMVVPEKVIALKPGTTPTEAAKVAAKAKAATKAKAAKAVVKAVAEAKAKAAHGAAGAAGTAGAASTAGGAAGTAAGGAAVGRPKVPIHEWNAANGQITSAYGKELGKNTGGTTLPSMLVVFSLLAASFCTLFLN